MLQKDERFKYNSRELYKFLIIFLKSLINTIFSFEAIFIIKIILPLFVEEIILGIEMEIENPNPPSLYLDHFHQIHSSNLLLYLILIGQL